ncbi:MAG: GntR family transcriptional regulator [Kaiparowitsia implicata GSE-PSE-MK54-09C]|jgi:GntR family transcriptional regulator|nr:GntR family transcriptional regulator [Kaiparowitsia implicata GSE-PSE-MK54-09C]
MAPSLHLSISEHLRHHVVVGDYQPGDQLPSEHQLMQEFGVSRTTIRRAIANLVNQGLVTAHQGKGVFVSEQHKVAYSLSSPLVFLEDDMARQGIPLVVTLLEAGVVSVPDTARHLVMASANPVQAAMLQEAQVYMQKKRLDINNRPGALDYTYLSPALSPLLDAAPLDRMHHMVFPLLEQQGIAISRIEAILECTHADPDICHHLEVPLGHPLIVYRHTAYTTENQPVAYGETISRGDRFCYSLTIPR